MIDLKNVLEVMNEVVVLPIVTITFFLMMYIVVYLWKKDPDVIRSKIFLRYNQFKKAFLLFAVFALVLIFHVSLIYIPHFYQFEDNPFIEDLQRSFGLVLAITMISFVRYLYESIK